MSGGYSPKVAHPFLSNNIVQMRSGELQTPFFFGGSQAPTALKIPASAYSGSSGAGVFSKGTPSLTKIGRLDFTTKKGDKVFHRQGKDVVIPHITPFSKDRRMF
jgi:hypothetical protein